MTSKIIWTVAIIGVGRIAQAIHIPSILSFNNLKLVQLIDPYMDHQQLMHLARLLNCTWSSNIDQVKADLVVIATPISTHYEIGISLIERGMNVYIEKPLSVTYDQAKALIKAAQQHNVRIFCAQIRRFAPNVQVARSVIEAGLLGNLTGIYVYLGNLYNWERQFYSSTRDEIAAIDESVLYDVGAHAVDSVIYTLENLKPELLISRSLTDDMQLRSNIVINGQVHLNNSRGKSANLQIHLSNSVSLSNVIWFQGIVATLLLPFDMSVPPSFFTQCSSRSLRVIDSEVSGVDFGVQQYRTIMAAMESGMPCMLDASQVSQSVKVLEDVWNMLTVGDIEWLR